MKVKQNGELRSEVDIDKRIRQGDSLGPFLFNVVVDEIIKN